MRVKCDGCDRVDHASRHELIRRNWRPVTLDWGTPEQRDRIYCGRCADEVLAVHRSTARSLAWRKALPDAA